MLLRVWSSILALQGIASGSHYFSACRLHPSPCPSPEKAQGRAHRGAAPQSPTLTAEDCCLPVYQHVQIIRAISCSRQADLQPTATHSWSPALACQGDRSISSARGLRHSAARSNWVGRKSIADEGPAVSRAPAGIRGDQAFVKLGCPDVMIND